MGVSEGAEREVSGTGHWLVLAAGVHAAGFAAFHVAFWRLFGWPGTLRDTTFANRAILQIANVQLIVVFGVFAALCFAFTDAVAGTPLGRAVLGGMALFWIVRVVVQCVWLRVSRPMVHVLTALFVLGAALCAGAALA